MLIIRLQLLFKDYLFCVFFILLFLILFFEFFFFEFLNVIVVFIFINVFFSYNAGIPIFIIQTS